jgi:ABC-type uncharacterized transport system involved in gliding motility auxiliary subunit
VTTDDEQSITNGLIKVVQGQQPKVYFVTGHGERDLNGSDQAGYGGIAGEMKGDNFLTEPLVLLQQDIPADAAVVVIAGPTSDLLEPEVAKLKAYLAKGGKLMVLIDPPQKADAPPQANLIALLKDWSVEVGNDAVLDPMSQLRGTQASVPVAAQYPFHQITDNFRLLTAYPYTRSVKPIEGASNGRTATSIVMSGRNSWAESDLKRLTNEGTAEPELDKGDVQGPLSMAVAVTAPVEGAAPPPADRKEENPSKPETRLVVVGDSDFASNSVAGMGGNRDMFLNMVNWLAKQENLISVRTRSPEDRRITMTAGQDRMIFWFTMLILPGLIFLAGIQTWWRRR